MKKTMLFVQLMWLTVFGAFAQITFETLPMDTAYWNGGEQSGFFRDGNYRLMNSYDDSWGVWSGFAYSKMTDTVTTGWINQYSVMAGAGADGSEKFALAYAYSPVGIKLEEADTVDGFYVTNSTYAYLSMRDGDAYAKKFGGDSGDDADWFKLTVKGWNGGTQTNSVDFYLADYRFSDNTQDYILKDWKFVDLSSLGLIDSLSFELSSSDTGAYGMNTPSYFCMDNIISENHDKVTFEDLPFKYWNGRNLTGGFSMDSAYFVNYYTISDYGEFASGWIFSMMTDTVTAGYTNPYSAMAGKGYDGSLKYAVANVSSYSGATYIIPDTVRKINGFYVTNNSYAYLSMRDGDTFAKKFGGDSGDDADWFKLTVKGWNGGTQTNSVDFYLADYRFSDNTQDYILKDWKFVDLSSLGFVDSLTFELSSSDTGAYGMNTPSYFCLDNLSLGEKQNTKVITEQPTQNILSVYPNPTSDYVVVRSESPMTQIKVFDISGKLYVSDKSSAGMFRLNLSNVPAGVYFLQVKTNGQVITKRIVKK